MDLFIAEYDTRHYQWNGVGRTEDEAKDALLKAWYAFCKVEGTDRNYIKRSEIWTWKVTPGQGYCDREPLPRPRT